jgi:hypothetical protein
MAKYVYFFGSGKAESRADMKDLLGGAASPAWPFHPMAKPRFPAATTQPCVSGDC